MNVSVERDSWKKVTLIILMVMDYKNIANVESAPVRVWGDLTAIYRERDYNAGSNSAVDSLLISTVNVSSYIWQPWFALVDGSLSLTSDKRENSDQVNVNNQYLRGKFRLNLFPSSRFPALFYAEKNTNERYDELFARNIVNTVVGLRQQYISLDGKHFYSANVERAEREDIDQESFVNDSANIKARYKMNNNIFYGDVDYSKIEKPTRADALNYALTARHTYANNSNFTVDSRVSTTQSHNDFITNSNDTKNNQVSSFLLWRPGRNPNLHITGSLRVSDLEQRFQQYDLNLITNTDNVSERATININQGLIYNYSPRITFTESINRTELKNKKTQQYINSEAVGVTYNSGSLDFNSGYYNWYATSNLNRQYGATIQSEKYFKNQLGHSLSKDFMYYQTVLIQTTFNQSVAYEIRENQENSSYFNHSVTANWSKSNFVNTSAIRFTYTDIRNMSIESNVFQLANIQFSYDYRINRHTHFLANVTLQKSQISTNLKTTNTQYSNGQVSYNTSRFFNVTGLSFKSELRISNKVNDGDEITSSKYGSYRDNMWRNEIVYRVGLFESRVSLDYVKNGDVYDRVFKIQLTRNFGDI